MEGTSRLAQDEYEKMRRDLWGTRQLLDECVKQNQEYRDRNKELEQKVRSLMLENQQLKVKLKGRI